MKIKGLPLFILILICISCQNRQAAKVEELDKIFSHNYEDGLFNGAVLIAENGVTIYRKSFGIADESTKSSLNDSSIFELASVSKQFTALGIAILKKDQKLSYDDELSKYIPELSFYKNVKISHLIHHTSGLPDYMALMDSLFDKTKIATNENVIQILAETKPEILFEPNSKFEYSNTGYVLLATIIERVSDKSFSEFLRSEIFNPLGMDNSFVYNRRYYPQDVKNYAYGYLYSDSLQQKILPDSLGATKFVRWLDGIYGDGTVNSTTLDLLKWDRAIATSKLVSNETWVEIFKSSTTNDNASTEYGFGWFLEENDDYGRIASHGGGWPGYSAYIERHLDHDKTIIILQNIDRGTVNIDQIRSVLYGKPFSNKIVIELGRPILETYQGNYQIQEGPTAKVYLNEKGLFIQVGNQQPNQLHPETKTKFFIKEFDAQVEFLENDQGIMDKLILYQKGSQIEALKTN